LSEDCSPAESILYELIKKHGVEMKKAENSPGMKTDIFQRFNMWMIIKYLAFCVVILVEWNMISEAYDVKKAVVWVNDKIATLVWDIPNGRSHHYRIELSKTNILQEPVTTYVSHIYSKDNKLQVELDDNYAYTFRAQSVGDFGALSTASEVSPLYIYKKPQLEKPAAVTEEKPREFSLSQNFPNPFNRQTTIQYYVASTKNNGDRVSVELVIYNSLGQKIRTLVNGANPPGSYAQIWDSRDDSGRDVSSGHYFYQLTAGDFRASKKMILMK
jgi:hypothetical protein